MRCECKHYVPGQDVCAAGVSRVSVRDPRHTPYGYPCLTDLTGSPSCEKAEYEAPPIESGAGEFDAAANRSLSGLQAISGALGKAMRGKGTLACPSCGAKLRYSFYGPRAGVYACETPGCTEGRC